MLKKTVEEIQDMSYPEYCGWGDYLRRRPSGWQDDLRAFHIMRSSGNLGKTKPEELFPSIKAMLSEQDKVEDEIKAAQTLKASAFGFMLAAAGIKGL